MALSLNDLKKGKAPKPKDSLPASQSDPTRRMVRPWEDPTQDNVNTQKEETGSKLVANQEQTGSNLVSTAVIEKNEKDKPVAQPVARRVANWEQTGSKPVANLSITQVVGNEQKLLYLIFEECKKEGNLTSPPLTKEFISRSLETSHGTVKSAILRLERKGLLARQNCKVGRGGWLQFSLAKEVFQKMLLNQTGSKPVANQEQTGSKPVAKPVAQPVANLSSSSSSLRSLINKEELLTTGGELAQTDQLDLDAVWQKIDCSPLTDIRFGRHQVAQIAREGKFTPEELQDSIYAFAFDLSENGKAKTITGVPLNYFMGILRRGPYAAPSNYESPDVRQKRLYLESKEQQRKKHQELNERLETVEFAEWLERLSLDQRAAVVPPKDFAKPGGTAHNYQMREYFRENVWPQIREESQTPEREEMNNAEIKRGNA